VRGLLWRGAAARVCTRLVRRIGGTELGNAHWLLRQRSVHFIRRYHGFLKITPSIKTEEYIDLLHSIPMRWPKFRGLTFGAFCAAPFAAPFNFPFPFFPLNDFVLLVLVDRLVRVSR